jgi:hypothetical protein
MLSWKRAIYSTARDHRAPSWQLALAASVSPRRDQPRQDVVQLNTFAVAMPAGVNVIWKTADTSKFGADPWLVSLKERAEVALDAAVQL